MAGRIFAVIVVSPTYSVPSVRPWRAMEGQGPSSVSAWDDIGIELLPAYAQSSVSVVLFVVAVSASLVLGGSSPGGAHRRRQRKGRQLYRRRGLKENKGGSKTARRLTRRQRCLPPTQLPLLPVLELVLALAVPLSAQPRWALLLRSTPAGTSAPSANGTRVSGTAQPSALPVPAPTSTSTSTSTSPPSASPTVEVYDCFDNNPCMDAAAGEGGVRYYRHADPTRFVQCGAGATCFTMDCHEGRIWSLADTACVSNAAAPADQGP